jgi:light-regulated signal transduction histidine kinase (bacteriophytochrome)
MHAANLDDAGKSYLAFVSEGGTRAQQMLNGLLQYSRVYTQATPRIFTDMHLALERALLAMRSRITASGASITCKELPEAFIDDNQMELLFRIIIENALTYCHSTIAPAIEITTQESESYWRILVSDNGIGIAKENAERIFQFFKRLHPDESYPGIGMGLPIARRIVERHGGEIGVMPQRTRGTTCWFTLPKSVENAGEPEADQWQELSHG